jgi:hypothetical protein
MVRVPRRPKNVMEERMALPALVSCPRCDSSSTAGIVSWLTPKSARGAASVATGSASAATRGQRCNPFSVRCDQQGTSYHASEASRAHDLNFDTRGFLIGTPQPRDRGLYERVLKLATVVTPLCSGFQLLCCKHRAALVQILASLMRREQQYPHLLTSSGSWNATMRWRFAF